MSNYLEFAVRLALHNLSSLLFASNTSYYISNLLHSQSSYPVAVRTGEATGEGASEATVINEDEGIAGHR